MAISKVDDGEKRPDSLDPRVYFAAERTLLAWVRTGLAMMGFGFVVARCWSRTSRNSTSLAGR
jgi:uncharacterized membrane protein YidH (DUF202 family)